MAEVYALIKEAPICYTVNGCPCQPWEQGSVEHVNRDIRNAISHAITAQVEQSGVNKAWLDVLPEVQSSLNKGLTPYHTNFGDSTLRYLIENILLLVYCNLLSIAIVP